MKSFMLALGFIGCFIIGGFSSIAFCEYYNKMLRSQYARLRSEFRPVRAQRAYPASEVREVDPEVN